MQRRTLFLIVPEGWMVLCLLVAGLVAANMLVAFWAALAFVPLIVLGIGFFRDSPRDVPAEPLSVIAPVDGIVAHRRECYDPYLDREAVKLTIRVNPFGDYLLRSPVEGTVLELPGELLEEIGGVATHIRTDEGDELVMAIRHGSLFGQRPCNNSFGERVGQGRCCGNRRLAREVALFLPVNSRMEVELGDRVRGGTSVLARLVHKHNGRTGGDEMRRPRLDGVA